MLEISEAYGLTLSELVSKMSAAELQYRVTQRLLAKGWTFDPEKIAEIQDQQRREAAEAFLAKARAEWNKSG